MNQTIIIDNSEKEFINEFFNLNIEQQNICYYKYSSHCTFHEKILIEKDEEIIYIEKQNKITKGYKNYFVKCVQKHGFTYKFKGSTNSRLNIWKSNNIDNYGTNLLILNFIENFNNKVKLIDDPDLIICHLKNYDMAQLFTKGLLSRIMSNKIQNKDDIYKYYTQYGLRNFGVSKNNWENFKKFYEKLDSRNHFWKLMILRLSDDPNKFLEGDIDQFAINCKYLHNQTFEQIMATSIKIDWHNLDYENFYKNLKTKLESMLTLVDFYTSGPSIQNTLEESEIPF